jgi:ElaB/YqjD/DUF883 family membrane-anchored ribosome-binding protein
MKPHFQGRKTVNNRDLRLDKDRVEKLKEALPMMENIKEDIDSLRSNMVGLAKSIKSVSSEKARVTADYLMDQVDNLKTTGSETLGKVETQIKERPGQSIAVAFAAGVLTSYLLNRRLS